MSPTHWKKSVCTLAAMASLGACAAEPLAETTTTSTALTRCVQYPLVFPADAPAAQADAQADLAGFAPAAQLTWSSRRGTPTVVTGLDLVVACEGDVGNAVGEHLAQHPALYRFRPAEWRTDALACTAVTQATYVRFERASFGGVPIAKDVLNVRVEPANAGAIRILAMAGAYLRPAPPLLASALAGCQKTAAADAVAVARATTFDYVRFDACLPVGKGTYVPQPKDDVRATGASAMWTWDESPEVVLRAERSAEVRVAPSHWTPELLASDAYCPLQATVGFALTVDAVSGRVTRQRAGLGCIVCAR